MMMMMMCGIRMSFWFLVFCWWWWSEGVSFRDETNRSVDLSVCGWRGSLYFRNKGDFFTGLVWISRIKSNKKRKEEVCRPCMGGREDEEKQERWDERGHGGCMAYNWVDEILVNRFTTYRGRYTCAYFFSLDEHEKNIQRYIRIYLYRYVCVCFASRTRWIELPRSWPLQHLPLLLFIRYSSQG